MEDHERGREAFASEEEYRLHALRHSTAHIMAEAIGVVFPGARFAIGPATKDGFFYDVDDPQRQALVVERDPLAVGGPKWLVEERGRLAEGVPASFAAAVLGGEV